MTIGGNTLRTALEELGWKQKDLARKLDVTEVTVSKWARSGAPEYVKAYLQMAITIKRITAAAY